MCFDRLNVLLLQREIVNRIHLGAKLTTNVFMWIGSVTVMTIVQMVQMKTDVVCLKLISDKIQLMLNKITI